MEKQLIVATLEALSVGDSFGKCTEFASRSLIRRRFHSIDRLLTPQESLAHSDMRYAQVTDDTEQNIFLIEDFAREGKVTAEIAANSILRWFRESPEPEKYIGPSTRKAIAAIQAGEPIETAGKTGVSCGGVMRVPAVFLCSSSFSCLKSNVVMALSPTHNTPSAMEAAMGYAYALWKIREGGSIDEITEAAIEGCSSGKCIFGERADSVCAPCCASRIRHLRSVWRTFHTQDDLLDFLFYVFGTTISSCDVFVAAFALFLWAQKNVFLSIKMAAMLGGDTDTIGCLAAVLCCLYAHGHNIPSEIVEAVRTNNHIDYNRLAKCVLSLKKEGLE